MWPLFFIGLLMGVCDLVPGVSGGTVAFLFGIYEALLEAIKSLQFQTLKKVQWRFLLPLGMGVICALLLCSKGVYYLLEHHKTVLFSSIFAMILVSSAFLIKKELTLTPPSLFSLFLGAGFSFMLCALSPASLESLSFSRLIFFGVIASSAMLLPGISGSYILHLVGIYPVVMFALSHPLETSSIQVLSALGVGIAFGLLFCSRLIALMLQVARGVSLAFLIGVMLGGLRSLWAFHSILDVGCALLCASVLILLEIKGKRSSSVKT